MYYCKFHSPLGEMVATSDGENLTGLYFSQQKYFDSKILLNYIQQEDLNIFKKLKRYLNDYFIGKIVDNSNILIKLNGTEYQKMVWEILSHIPYGKTMSYKQIADIISKKTNKKPSARAVGRAVGHNPISIIVPCHRVISASGDLTGYAGGIDKKIALLKIEKILK